MNSILKKIFSVVIFVSCLASPAYGSGRKNESNQEKKPCRIRLVDKKSSVTKNFEKKSSDVSFSLFMQGRYRNFLQAEKSKCTDSKSLWFLANKMGFRREKLECFGSKIKRFIFESGSISFMSIRNILYDLNINNSSEMWVKKVYPLTFDNGDVVEDGFKLVLTHKSDEREIVFYFKFGNVSTIKAIVNYDFTSEVENYNKFVDLTLGLKADNPFKVNLDKISVNSVKEVVVSEKTKNIKKYGFLCAEGLQTVDILGRIFSIGECAFMKCRNLKTVNFHHAVKSVDDSAFKRCLSLQEIYFPEGLKFIGEHAFEECYSLKKIVIPFSTEIIYAEAFKNTPDDLKIIYAGVPYSKNNFFEAFFVRGGLIADKNLPDFES